LFGGAFFTPVIVGKITHTLGWQWTFYFIAIFSAVILPFVILFVPETAYRRAATLIQTSLAKRTSITGAISKLDMSFQLRTTCASAQPQC
jgi:MFS family permease